LSSEQLLHRALQQASAALEQGDATAALAEGRRAVTLAPDHAGARNLLGLAQLQAGQAPAAVAELERAARLAKNNHAILGNLAQAYALAGRHNDAYQTYRRAMRLAPAHWPYAQGAAIALAQQGQAATAEPLLRRLTERFPQEASLWYNLGNVQRDLCRLDDAANSYREALRIAPADFDAQLNLGAVLHAQSQFAAAESVYRECIRAQPDWVPVRLNLISVLIDDGRFDQAVQECRALIASAPRVAEAHRFLGAALSLQGRLADAVRAHRAAADLAPNDAVNQRSLGGSLAELGQLHPALRILARADALEPGALALQQLLSMIYLSHGLFADGWSAYRSRPAYLRLTEKWPDTAFAQSLPDALAGKHVLIRREQGLGDELFFLRWLPLLKARGAHVTVYASAKIADMIRRTGIADDVRPDTALPPAGVDLQMLCGDLPHALHCCPSSPLQLRPATAALRDFPISIGAWYPEPAPSLRIAALPVALDQVREQLQRLGPPPYLGITWRAGTAAREQLGADWVLSKEVPLTALGRALRQAPGTLIALQRNPSPGEIDALAAACERRVGDCTGLNENLEQMLALLSVLDNYVGVSNTNMHLRAAAGRAACVLVPNPAEWRWLHSGRRSPWFPAFSIYRQSLHGDWAPALDALGRDLANNA
jgi:Flp pilus assembly protein TadD